GQKLLAWIVALDRDARDHVAEILRQRLLVELLGHHVTHEAMWRRADDHDRVDAAGVIRGHDHRTAGRDRARPDSLPPAPELRVHAGQHPGKPGIRANVMRAAT